MTSLGPPGLPRTRALLELLRTAMQTSQVTVRELARRLGIGHATTGRWHQGVSVPSYEDIEAAVEAMDLAEADRDQILGLARTIRDRAQDDWLISGPGGNEQLAGLRNCEHDAVGITAWNGMMIPGPLQAPQYVKATLSHGGLSNEEIKHRALLRSIRRADLLTPDDRVVQFTAFLGEAALHSNIGGPAAMREQLADLLTVGAHPTVTVRVVPTHVDFHPGMTSPFMIYAFADALPDIVYIEHHAGGGTFYVTRAIVQDYRDAATAVAALARSPEESQEMINAALHHIDEATSA